MKVGKKLIAKICLTFALVLSLFGATFTTLYSNTAKADTVEYQDILAVEDRSWGAASDEYYFGGYTIGASTTDNAHWLNTADSVNGCWHNDNHDIIAANNGVDILKYIYVNDKSARDAITENRALETPLVGSTGWLTNPAASPVYVETTNGSGLLIKILKAYAGENFTLTFKAGFRLLRNDGNVIYLSDDVVYNCAGNVPTRVEKSTVTFNNESGVAVSTKRVVNGQAIGTLPKVSEKDGYGGFWTINGMAIDENTIINSSQTVTPVYGIEYEDLLGLEDRTSWGAHDGEYYFGGVTLSPFGYFNTQTTDTWHADTTAPITANAGIDIMKYIYVNGECARDLIVANFKGEQNKNSCGCWLSNPAAWPVYVETTTGSGIMIRLAKAYFGDTITFTFKKGFSLVRNDGERIYVSSDITYTYANGTLGGRTVDKNYTLTFEGTDVVKTLKNGTVIGELPTAPSNGTWAIDGVEITADMVFNYGANKTATVIYTRNITETIGLGDWGVPESEPDIRYLWIRDNNAEIITAYPNSYWNDHADNKDSNYGVDIMEYILIDGESARSIINANAAGTTSYKASSTFPLNVGGCYAPICIETAGDGIRFKVMVDYKTSFKVTFKAGFTVVNTDGVKLYTTKDVTYNVGANAGDITKEVETVKYTLSFEGLTESKEVVGGTAIGELPAVPEKQGFVGVWTIDGVDINSQTVYNYGENKTAVAKYVQKEYTLSFEGTDKTVESITVEIGKAISNLPEVPAKEGCIGWWTIDGEKITAETVYNFSENKVATANYMEVVDISDRIAIEDRAWGAHAGEIYVGVLDMGITNTVTNDDGTTSTNNYLNTSVTGTWHADDSNIIAQNGGVDIMKYIYVNGQEARALITDNYSGAQNKNSCGCWMSNPAAYPVYVETTNGGGIMIRLATAQFGTEVVITFKAGFTIQNANGQQVFLSKDVNFKYQNNACAKAYTLSFEGADEEVNSITVGYNLPMINLPQVPEREGMAGRWTIDGTPITSATAFAFESDKTAVAEYYQKYFTLTFEGVEFDPITVEVEVPMSNLPEIPQKEGYIAYWTIDGEEVDSTTVFAYDEDKTVVATYIQIVDISGVLYADDWGSPSGMDDLTYIRVGITRDEDGTLMIPSFFEDIHWQDHAYTAESNFGCDIMSYIYINGVSAREISNKNGEDRTYGGDDENRTFTFPFNYGGVYAPIDVHTAGTNFTILILKDFANHGEFTITFKEGFTLRSSEELSQVFVLTEDVEFKYGTIGENTVFGRDFKLYFEGVETVKTVFSGDLIGELPAVPEVAGYNGIWSVDGQEISAESYFSFYKNAIAKVKYTAIDYTITINRANGEVETLTFNDTNKTEVLASISLTANDLFYAYSWKEALPETLEFTDYTFEEVATEVPASTRIISYSLTVGVEFTMNVYVEVVGDVPTMKFTMGDREVIANGILADETLGKYVYKFDGIKAYELATEFTATVVNGETEIDSIECSVEAYLVKLAKTEMSEELKTLVADVIAYGQSAENYQGVEDGISEIEGLTASEYVDLTASNSTKTESTSADVAITKANVNYDGNSYISVLFTATDVSNVTVKINGVSANFTEVEEGAGVYVVKSDSLYVTNADVKYTFEIFVGGEKVQTLVYNVKSYLYEIQGEETEMSELLKTIYNLTLSAKAYSKGE